MTGLMAGKRGLIMGLANDRSLAWGIAKQLREQGAELAFSYQGEALLKRVAPLAAELGSDFLIDCDVADMAALDTAFDTLKARWPTIDFLVHAIGFSDKNELRGKFVDTSFDNFQMTMNISAYSFVAGDARARRRDRAPRRRRRRARGAGNVSGDGARERRRDRRGQPVGAPAVSVARTRADGPSTGSAMRSSAASPSPECPSPETGGAAA
jgi:NAD(P)-dependent dehydrogenase (short-subunit alcohol dehydrogenase family)